MYVPYQFDHTSRVDQIQRTLEANLATITDSADLLRAEIAKEEALLAEEKLSLQEMERNAKRAEVERKRQMKNVGINIQGRRKSFRCISDIAPIRNILSCASLTIYHKQIAKGALSLHFWTLSRVKQLWTRYEFPALSILLESCGLTITTNVVG
jgi:hypothetical protein